MHMYSQSILHWPTVASARAPKLIIIEILAADGKIFRCSCSRRIASMLLSFIAIIDDLLRRGKTISCGNSQLNLYNDGYVLFTNSIMKRLSSRDGWNEAVGGITKLSSAGASL